MDKKIICSMGGGFSSTAHMPRVLLEKYDKDDIHFVSCILPNEHPSTWDLFDAVEKNLGISITYIAYSPDTPYWQYVDRDDRANTDKLFTPFDIFDMRGFIGNSKNDPCSYHLKRDVMLRYTDENFGAGSVTMAVGIHNEEIERHIAIQKNWGSRGYETIFPLLDSDVPRYSREEQIEKLDDWYGVTLDLYTNGFEHNNCAGACVKAAQRQWAMLWYYYPDTYNEWETRELAWQKKWGRDNAIIRRGRIANRTYTTLKDYRIGTLEPASRMEKKGFMQEFIASLEDGPSCFWCSAI